MKIKHHDVAAAAIALSVALVGVHAQQGQPEYSDPNPQYQGKSVSANDSTETVLKRLEAEVRAKPNAAEPLARYGLALVRLGRTEEGLNAVTRAAAKAPNDPAVTLLQAKALWKSGRKAQCIAIAEKITTSPLATKKQTGEAYRILGTSSMWQGDYVTAEDQLRMSVEADPENTGALLNLGLLLNNLQKPQEALGFFQKAARRAPEDVRVQSAYAQYLERMGLFERSRDAYEQVARLNPDDGNVRFKLGSAYIAAGRYEKAALHLKKAVELNDVDVNAHVLLSQTLLRMGEFNDARYHAERADYLGASSAKSILQLIEKAEQEQ